MAVRVVLALALLAVVGWYAWQFKDRPVASRPLLYAKGQYLGPRDAGLDRQHIEALRERARQIAPF